MKEYFQSPTECPSCDAKLVIDGKFLMCKNADCPGGKLGNLYKWVKKLDLKGIAKATLEKLYDGDLIENPADLYKLRPEMICGVEGFGRSSANKIIETMNSKKELTLDELISALNIPNFSGKTAKKLMAEGLDSVDKILSTNIYDLELIKGIAHKTATFIKYGLKKKVDVIEQLLNVGITIKEVKPMGQNAGTILAGKSFCFTGAIQKVDDNGKRYKRSMMEDLVTENGGSVASVSNGLTYLVQANISSQSSKTKKAIAAGIEILSEVDFFKLIG